jgi:leader peptidase (prepilin peptidase)/N-methyltransferase
MATGVLAALGAGAITGAIGWAPTLPAHLLLVLVTTILIVTDLDHMRIPNRILYPGGIACLVLLAAGALVEGRRGDLLRGLAAGSVYWAVFLVVWLAARGQGFGFGDVRLAALLGLFLGFHSWQLLARGLLATALLGGVPAIVLLFQGKGRKTLLPYGPPLILGTWLAIAIM